MHSFYQVFEKEDFTCEVMTFNGTMYGSAKEHLRTWFVVWDIPRRVADELGLTANFLKLMNNLQMEKYPIEDFLMDPQVLNSLLSTCSYGANMRSGKGER